mgnify:CR=1 FL=1
MTATTTYKPNSITAIGNSGNDIGKSVYAYLAFAIKNVPDVNDVIVKILDTEYDGDLTDDQLTRFGLHTSEPVLKKLWENEDDDYWNSFL